MNCRIRPKLFFWCKYLTWSIYNTPIMIFFNIKSLFIVMTSSMTSSDRNNLGVIYILRSIYIESFKTKPFLVYEIWTFGIWILNFRFQPEAKVIWCHIVYVTCIIWQELFNCASTLHVAVVILNVWFFLNIKRFLLLWRHRWHHQTNIHKLTFKHKDLNT